MFDFLKGGKVTLNVEIDRPSGPYHPGETVKATATLDTSRELKVRSGRAALIRQEEYEYSYESTDSDGDTSYDTMWSQDRTVMDQQEFLGETVFPAGTQEIYHFTFTLPLTAQPTGSGSIFRLNWLVEITLDRKMAGDVNGEAEVVVVSTPPGQAIAQGEYGQGQSDEPDQAELTFLLPGQEWLPGQTLTGELRIYPHKSFTANEIRLELVQYENVPYDQGNTDETTIVEVKLADKTQFNPDEPLSCPFQLALPADMVPSTAGDWGAITWYLRGILARTLRSDTHGETEIMVYSGRFN